MTKNKIVFLDRDGTINYHRSDYVKNLSEFKILPFVGKYLSLLNKENFKLVVITNQSAINRKFLSIEELDKIHNFMKKSLEKEDCIIHGIYFCPHRPDENCLCRKPKTKLLENAIEDFYPVDLTNSWMVGDSDSDIEAGLKMKLNTFKINTDDSLENAVNHILSHKN